MSPNVSSGADVRRSLMEARPFNRGFVAPLRSTRLGLCPFAPPGDADPSIAEAADLAARRLAFDGLFSTCVRALAIVARDEGAARNNAPHDPSMRLRQAGLPLDLLAHFQDATGAAVQPEEWTAATAARLARGATIEEICLETAGYTFDFRQTAPGFAAVIESGETEVGLVRLQLTRGDYWSVAGAGENLDMARQLFGAFPKAAFVASIEQKHVDALRTTLADWPEADVRRLTLIAEPWPLAQWAHDNGKAGSMAGGGGDSSAPATLVPRYASRREDGSVFVPGESFVMDGVASIGHRVIHSPLIFQGGNLLVVRDARTRERIMLVGEAEVYRNTALGLSFEQVLAAFRVEFGVDRCVVLPAASFHLDYDVSVRTRANETVAFVNDSRAAARVILDCGIGAMQQAGAITADAARAAQQALAGDRPAELLGRLGPALSRPVLPGGGFPESFARHFSIAAGDSGVGNLQCFLLALDTFVHDAIRPTSPEAAAYLASFRRREEDRAMQRKILSELGWRVVPVPSLSDERRGPNYLNGIHDRQRWLMPAWGGLYTPLDEAAQRVFEREIGAEVRVVPVHCAESQRRAGAIHCSATVYPRAAPGE